MTENKFLRIHVKVLFQKDTTTLNMYLYKKISQENFQSNPKNEEKYK